MGVLLLKAVRRGLTGERLRRLGLDCDLEERYPMIGKVIKDNYKIMDRIGRGSVATAYLAKDTARNLVVALKIIHPEQAAEGQFLQRFQREARLLQMLTSPQAVKVFDHGEDEGLNFIALEYVQGETLASILEEGPLEVNRALDIAKQVALCLVDAHAKSIVHRDIRPANIMVTADGAVKVMDFGIAWGAELSRLTATGVLGSPHYLSPEQAEGKEVDGRSDLYSLGVTLFEMLTGEKPYDADSPVDIVLKHISAPVPCLRQFKEEIPLQVDELVGKCLAKAPEGRYQSAAELLEAIDVTLRAIAAEAHGSAMGMEANLKGQTLGAYQIIEQIGRGGMATVYKAYEPALERYVAIKILPQYFAHDPDFTARFEREAKAVAKLDHPNILPIYSFGQEAGRSYIAMRYVEAGTLKEMLGQPLDLKTTADILEQIGRALDYAHQRGIVHRDVKPTNVLMAEGKWALLTDFGLARMVESSVQLTKSGVGVGTPAYMSPEQGQGLKVDARSDVYSLGVVLYEMVTGKVPYEAETPMAVVLKHITAPLPLPRQLNPEIPEAVERVILKALAKRPDDRYATVKEMVAALREAVARAEVREAAAPSVVEVAEVAVPVLEEVKLAAAPAEVAKPERRIQWGKVLGKAAREMLGMIFFIALTAGVVIWAIRNPDTVQRIIDKVGPVVAGIVGKLPGEPSTADEARAFAEPILAAIAEREPDYFDDFSDPNSGWPVQSDARQEIGYEDGVYSVLIKTADTGSGLFMDELHGFDDFVAQVDVRWISSEWRGNAGFLWRFERDKPCYGGWISPVKDWGMWNRAKTMEVGGGSSHIHGEQEWNRLTLIVRGEDIALYANDEPIAFASDDECRTGGVQLNVHAGEPGVHVQLDNVKVWDISNLALAGETPVPTRTPADQARAFAEPILAAIADRRPDYSDDFSDPGSGWPIGSTAVGDEWGYEDDAYFISATYLPQGECCIGARPDPAPSFSDFVLEVDARFVSDEWGGWAVIFRDAQEIPEQPVSAHYGVRFYPDGAFGIWKNVSGTHADLVETEVVASAFERGFETNHLTIIAQGPQTAVYVNGEPLWFVYDESSSRGMVSLVVENQTEDTTLRVRFDNLKVWDISDVALPAQPNAVVTAEALNLRAGPGADHDRVSVVREGDELDVVARTPAGDWLKVIAPDGTEGWVAAAYVVLNIALYEIPEAAELPPPPAPPGRIVYADDRTGNDEIYVANSDGSDERRLTDHPSDDREPTWSPDGTRIVFSSDRDAVAEDNRQLYIMDADGSNLTRLTYTERNDVQPSWSSDGSRIAFHSWCDLAVINADGSNWTLLMEGREDLCVEFPTWSPNSHRIAFRSMTPTGGPPPLQHDIYVVNDDGSGLLKLATFISEEWGWYVVWSPDGSRVVFDIWLDGQWRYYAVNSDGSGEPVEIEVIPDSWYPNFWPQWAEAPGEEPVVFTAAPTPTPIPAAVPPETPISPPSAGTGSATGRILWNDEPFAGVVVKLCTDWSMIGGCKGVEYTAVSGTDGRYSIADLPPGTYDVATQVPGQENETGWMGVKAEVQSGETAQVKDLAVVKYDLQLLSPREEETVKTATPALTWAGYPHAAYYKVYLAPSGGGETVIQFEKTTDTTYTVASPLQPGKYYWSIHAYNDRRTKLAESSGHFTVAKD